VSQGTWFATGYPGLIARRLVARAAEAAPGARIYALAHARQQREARRAAEAVPGVHVFAGDVADVFHLAALGEAGAAELGRMNVDGTRNALELAQQCGQLRLFTHFSTACASGGRAHVIAEDELEMGQSFRSAYEETNFRAVQWVRRAAARGLPVTVVRPSSMVGLGEGSKAGAFRGEYHRALLAVTSPLASGAPLPGDGLVLIPRGAAGLRGARRLRAVAGCAGGGAHLPPGGPDAGLRTARARAGRAPVRASPPAVPVQPPCAQAQEALF